MSQRKAKYYAVADANGPITVRIPGEISTVGDAAEWFLMQKNSFVDDGRTDAEDDFNVCGDGMSCSDWADVMRLNGYEIADANLCGDHHWQLWALK